MEEQTRIYVCSGSRQGGASGSTAFPDLGVASESKTIGSHSASEIGASTSLRRRLALRSATFPSPPNPGNASKIFRSHIAAAASGVEIILPSTSVGAANTSRPTHTHLATDASEQLPQRSRSLQHEVSRSAQKSIQPISCDKEGRASLQVNTATQRLASTKEVGRTPPSTLRLPNPCSPSTAQAHI